ncbi:MAG: hypothetical protein ACREQM_04700 [Candidatus Dormibacteraceae bacterium]
MPPPAIPSCATATPSHVITFENGTKALGQGLNINYSACTAPAPQPLTPASSPPPDLAPYYAQIFEAIQTAPGSISAAPPNHTGLVNLPACFWLTGQSVPQQQQETMVLPGAPNPGGQQINYRITLTVKLQYTTWSFGDGSSAGVAPPIPCVGISGDPPSLVAHDYLRYSDGDFQVSAAETYAGSVTMSWIDDNGTHAQVVSGPTQTVTVAPYPIEVDQEEAVGTGS